MPRYNIDLAEEEAATDLASQGYETEETVDYRQGAAEAVDEIMEEVAPPEDKQLSEVEDRIELASTYNLVLNQSMFTEPTEHTQQVEKEIRHFIRGRLKVLLGISADVQPTTPSQFTAEEVMALKAIAGKVLKSPNILENPKPKPKGPPALAKVEQAPARTSPPAVARVHTPTARATPKPPSPAPAPNRRLPVPARPSVAPAKPQAVPRQPAVASPPPPVAEQGEGEVIYGKQPRRGFKRKAYKSTGEFNEKGEEILRDVTPQGKADVQGIPMPPQGMINQAVAATAAQNMSNLNPLISLAINRSLSTITAADMEG